jgi:Tfp pilus assembly protein PilN
VAILGVLLLVWGGSVLVKDELLRRQVRDELAAMAPQVQEAKALQDEIGELRKQIDILVPGQERRVTVLMKELSELVPGDAYLASMSLRNERLVLDGFARSASDLISALEKSKHFKNVTFTSPTTRVGDKERFALSAEVEK